MLIKDMTPFVEYTAGLPQTILIWSNKAFRLQCPIAYNCTSTTSTLRHVAVSALVATHRSRTSSATTKCRLLLGMLMRITPDGIWRRKRRTTSWRNRCSRLHQYTIYNNITWSTLNALNSDHNPIKISYNTKTKFRLIQHRRSYTNYRKADWQGFTNSIENALTDTTDVTDVHKSNKILTLLLLDADKHYIPKGKIRPNNPLLPENIRAQIKERDIIKANDPTDNRLEHLNKDISQAIQTHRSGIWKEHLDGHWDHRRNTYILWKTINGLSNKKTTPITNNTITFKNYTAITPKQKTNQFTKQFTNITKHKTKTHYRKIHRKIESLPTTPIKITIAQTSAALKSTKNTNSTGTDGLNIRHLKHLGPKGLDYLTKILNLSLNKNIIPQIWKLAKIIPIPKPNKDPHQGSSYRPISLLSPTAKLLEKIILPYITNNIPSIYHQHGFKTKHSTTTALHQLTNHITTGFNQKKPPYRTITIALDMSQAFDTVNHYTLIEKLINTNTPNLITRFIANYIRGRKAFNNIKIKTHLRNNSKLVFHKVDCSPRPYLISTCQTYPRPLATST